MPDTGILAGHYEEPTIIAQLHTTKRRDIHPAIEIAQAQLLIERSWRKITNPVTSRKLQRIAKSLQALATLCAVDQTGGAR